MITIMKSKKRTTTNRTGVMMSRMRRIITIISIRKRYKTQASITTTQSKGNFKMTMTRAI